MAFDFDHSLIDEDSDSWVFQQLAPPLLAELRQQPGRVQFTDLVDALLGRLQDAPGFALPQLAAALRAIPFHEDMRRMLRLVRKANDRARDTGVRIELLILSDANHFYISEILKVRYGICLTLGHVYSC